MGSDSIHRTILGQCYRVASYSPDTSTQVGVILTHGSGLTKGQTASYNGFVSGWVPTEQDYERPRKYDITAHAERRAIYKAARLGIPLEGCTMYATWAACSACAIAIVESGISRLVRHHPPHDETMDRWLESVSLGDEILKKGNVEIVDIYGEIPDAFPILRGGESFDPR